MRQKAKERVRVTRACDICKRKKTRCDGTLPCSMCTRQGLPCRYNALYNRGKVPPIPQHGRQNQSSMDSTDEQVNQADEPNPTTQQSEPIVTGLHSPSPTSIDEIRMEDPVPEEVGRIFSSRTSPEPPQTDLEGHYVGPSSGVAFLLRAQKSLHEKVILSQNTSIFTFGDAPLAKYDSSLLVLPSKDEAKSLVARYFDFAFPTHRFLHRPTVDKWVEELYSGLNSFPIPKGVREIRALLLLIMAQANLYPAGEKREDSPVQSSVYFGASEHYLAAETGPVRLTSIQARLAQCFYLLSHSRINHCWSLFGTTVRLLFAIGLHRRRRRETSAGMDVVELECRKRVFWCAYSLDNYLSAALGRPRSFHDEDIDQELPSCANDSEITSGGILPAPTKAQSIMLAPVFHAKLSKIISGVLKDLYGIRRVSLDAQITIAGKYETELTEWRQEIGYFLDSADVNMLQVIYQRQHTVLNLAYAHSSILVYRPFLLKNFAALARSAGEQQGRIHEVINTNINKCLKGALDIVQILRELCSNNTMFQAFWFTHYYSFCAIVVLYVYVIQKHQDPASVWEKYFKAGQQGQIDLSTCGSNVSLAQRYVLVLEELRVEALRLTRRKQQIKSGTLNGGERETRPIDSLQPQHKNSDGGPGLDFSTGLSSHHDSRSQNQLQQFNTSENPVASAGLQLRPTQSVTFLDQESPSSFLAEITGWGEFDSFVMAGMGEPSYLFSDNGLASQFLDNTTNDELNDWTLGREDVTTQDFGGYSVTE